INQEQSSSNNNAIDSEGNGMKTMATLLQNSIQGVQNSFSSVYTTLAANLKQSLEMTHTMNSVMEQFLLSNLRITSNITQIHKLETRGNFIPSLLTITIINSGQFPIPNISCSITFVKKDHNEPVNIGVECKESIKRGITNPDSETTSISSIFVPKTSTTTSIFTLSPQTQIIEKLKLAPSEFCQYNAKVNVRFASPGLENYYKRNTLSVYILLISARKVHVIVELSPYLLRQLWNVHPSSGLSEAMTFEISWKNEIYSLIHIKKWIGADNLKFFVKFFILIMQNQVLRLLIELLKN
ncbi:unnamed protein product, partial [Rhizophagus irregularis]